MCVQTIQKFRPRLMEYVDRNEISSEDAMALYLIEERADPESRFQTWFPLMPNEFESPPFFNKEELNLLKGDDIYQKAVNARRTYRRNFDRIQENVKDADFSYEDYVWAKHMIESRAWHLRGKQYLVPMADFFNHRPHPSVKYVVFEREAREFQSFLFFMFLLCHSNHKNVTRIAHSYDKNITLENQRPSKNSIITKT